VVMASALLILVAQRRHNLPVKAPAAPVPPVETVEDPR